MSSQRGNIRKKAPKHQNDFAFKHNPKSKKTNYILSLPNNGLCQRCHDQIEWRKSYRKYKPLTQPGTCNKCQLKKVTSAYHTICPGCAKEESVCGKCGKNSELIDDAQEEADKKEKDEKALEALAGLRERERRTVLRRQLQRETCVNIDDEEIDEHAC